MSGPDTSRKGSNRRLELELCAWFKAGRHVALASAMGQMMEDGLGTLGSSNLHSGGNPLDRQGGFLDQIPGVYDQWMADTADPRAMLQQQLDATALCRLAQGLVAGCQREFAS